MKADKKWIKTLVNGQKTYFHTSKSELEIQQYLKRIEVTNVVKQQEMEVFFDGDVYI